MADDINSNEVEALSPLALAIAGISAASAGIVDLAEFARYQPNHDLSITEVIENLADATKLAIEASGRADDEAGQLHAALSKFLEGWA